ncbi:hypothetical protein J2S16_001779 [Cytobacillus kochii]|nr:hypothetical protein [Cytobacillus kochii]
MNLRATGMGKEEELRVSRKYVQRPGGRGEELRVN